MEITRDTPIEEILKSQEVNDTILNMLNPIRQTISARDSMFTTTMQSGGGLDESQLIDGQPVLFKSAQDVKNKYSNLSESLNRYEANSTKVSVEKERPELLELKDCLNKDLEMRKRNIEALKAEYYDAIAKAKENKEDTDGIYEKYWNPTTGLIPLEEKEKKYDEDMLIKVDNRLAALEGTTAGQGELAGQQGTNGSNYEIDTSGSADDIYNSARAIRDEVEAEIIYLDDRIAELDYNLNALEQWKKAEKIPEDTYETLKAEYETEKSRIESEKEKREKYYEELFAATRDRIGAHDGALKDARDFGNNYVESARRIANELNASTATLTPLSELATIKYDDGTTRVVYPINPGTLNIVDAAYTGNLSGIVIDSSSATTTISDTTMKAAYEVAKSSDQVHTDPTGKIQIFSTGEYVLNPPNLNPYTNNDYLITEYYTLQETEALGNTHPYGDTIYDENMGRFYSLSEYRAIHPDFSFDSFQ